MLRRYLFIMIATTILSTACLQNLLSTEAQQALERGNNHLDTGDLDRAIADYDEAIELDPNYTEAYINRGVVYKNKGDLDRA
jgi:Tfp pilus assembly protein PilF